MSHKLGKKKIVDMFYRLKTRRTILGELQLGNAEHFGVGWYNKISRIELIRYQQTTTDCQRWLLSLSKNEFNYHISKPTLPRHPVAATQITIPAGEDVPETRFWMILRQWKGRWIIKLVKRDPPFDEHYTFMYQNGYIVPIGPLLPIVSIGWG